ncbi:hypothetical protein VC83_03885 [Pseudogymnoascus destructans]|uniref:Uncharacterized protein n=1 Tax=Pseudogymnoascus destructans TaxID=655981 RepID=A0A177AES9_9PEZI|nr:uncharacterized protein VC83_03885 [Pseudogymnoascus destructans]OAF59674.1 hypothetical protein VC83_03885 [Pseudogymnoascus destructans]
MENHQYGKLRGRPLTDSLPWHRIVESERTKMKLQLPDLAFGSDEPIRPSGHRVPEHTTGYQDHLTAFTDDAHGLNLAGAVEQQSVGVVSGPTQF